MNLPSCVFMWARKLQARANFLLQRSQAWGLSPATQETKRLQFQCIVNKKWHFNDGPGLKEPIHHVAFSVGPRPLEMRFASFQPHENFCKQIHKDAMYIYLFRLRRTYHQTVRFSGPLLKNCPRFILFSGHTPSTL